MHEKFHIGKKFKDCKPREEEPIPYVASKWKTRTCHILEFSDDPSCISEHLAHYLELALAESLATFTYNSLTEKVY